jgi:hypothetical protein
MLDASAAKLLNSAFIGLTSVDLSLSVRNRAWPTENGQRKNPAGPVESELAQVIDAAEEIFTIDKLSRVLRADWVNAASHERYAASLVAFCRGSRSTGRSETPETAPSFRHRDGLIQYFSSSPLPYPGQRA